MNSTAPRLSGSMQRSQCASTSAPWRARSSPSRWAASSRSGRMRSASSERVDHLSAISSSNEILRVLGQHANAARHAQADMRRGFDLAGVRGRIQGIRPGGVPRRVVRILHRAAGRIELLGQLIIAEVVRPQRPRSIPRHRTGPERQLSPGVARHQAHVQVLDVPVAIGIDVVEGRNLHAAQCGLVVR